MTNIHKRHCNTTVYSSQLVVWKKHYHGIKVSSVQDLSLKQNNDDDNNNKNNNIIIIIINNNNNNNNKGKSERGTFSTLCETEYDRYRVLAAYLSWLVEVLVTNVIETIK